MTAERIWGNPIRSIREQLRVVTGGKGASPGRGVTSLEEFKRGKAAGRPGAALPIGKPSAAEPAASGWPYTSSSPYSLDDALKDARRSASRGWQERYLQERSKTYHDYASAVERAAAERKLKEGLSWQPWKDPRRPLSKPFPPPPGRAEIIKKPIQGIIGSQLGGKIVGKVGQGLGLSVPILGQIVAGFELAKDIKELAEMGDRLLENLIGLEPTNLGEGIKSETGASINEPPPLEIPEPLQPTPALPEPPPGPTPYDPPVPPASVGGTDWYLVTLSDMNYTMWQYFLKVISYFSEGYWVSFQETRTFSETWKIWVRAPLNLSRVTRIRETYNPDFTAQGGQIRTTHQQIFIHGSGFANWAEGDRRINIRNFPYQRIAISLDKVIHQTGVQAEYTPKPEWVEPYPIGEVFLQPYGGKGILELGSSFPRIISVTPPIPQLQPKPNPQPIQETPRREDQKVNCPEIRPLLRQHQAQINNIISTNQTVINNQLATQTATINNQLATQTTTINNQLATQTANVNNIINTGNATINANLANVNANVTSAQNNILSRLGDMQSGLTANFDEVFRRVGAQVQGGLSGIAQTTKTTLDTLTTNFDKFSQLFSKTIKWLQIDRVLNVLILASTVHNAYMLSSNLGQTLISALNNILTAAGNAFGLRDVEDNPIDVGPIIGGAFEGMIKAIIGSENLEGIKAEWKKNNRILQTGRNILFAVQSINNSVIGAVEMVGSNVAKIGNALKKWGAVSERAFGWMNPTPNFQNKLFTTLESLEEAGGSIEMVGAEVVSSQEEINQFGSVVEEFNKAIAQEPGSKQGKESPEAQEIKAKEDAAKAASQSNV